MPAVLKKVAYSTAATAHGGRAGHVRSADGLVDFDLAQPGTTPEPAVNPETLFAAGYAACFQGALANRAKALHDIDTSDSVVTATVSFGGTDDGGVGLAVDIEVSIPNVDQQTAQQLVELAHQFCPYSKATRDNIVVNVKAV
ncbi:MAG TPA: Ohr family peroxiredoxin [Jatrophihabitans sp.]|nr:Ohr family peroxiredoxin [Jatrophihabitans sp.]